LEDGVLRKPRAVLFAAPVVLGGLVATLLRRRAVARSGGLLVVVAAAALLVVVLPPARGEAVPVSAPTPVSADLFQTIGTRHAAADPFRIAFDRPMDRSSVAGALRVEPGGPYSLAWDPAGRVVTVTPEDHWAPATLYRVIVSTTARAEDGGRLAAPMRSVVLTTNAGSARIAPTLSRASNGAVLLDTTFRISVDRPVTADALAAALRTDPSLPGTVVADAAAGSYRFVPLVRLAPGTDYRVWLEGLADSDGVPFASAPSVAVHTVAAPAVRSIRPKDHATRIERDAAITVRFSEPMDPGRTSRAIHVTAGGKPLAGRRTWSADARTLTFRPRKPLPFGASVVVSVDPGARSALGVDVKAAADARFTVRPKPVADTQGIPTGGAGAVNGSWVAVEQYYLRLMNCTRTGGWVTSGGACSSPGGRNVAPLSLSSSISAHVSRPYARLLATSNQCNHFIGGTPGDRLRAAGFSGYNWGENIGCRGGNPYGAVLGSHLFFQSERSYNGGHYRNLMNASFRTVGVGVWVASGRVRLVIDFYGG
jgi:uncharacterized protein YkwD